jgi:hypothetical protein
MAAIQGCGAVHRSVGADLVAAVCKGCACGADHVMTTTTTQPTAEPTPLPTTLAPSPVPTPQPTEEDPTPPPIVFNEESNSVAAALGLLILSRAF